MPKSDITKNMPILDVVSQYNDTVEVFRRYDSQAGECICCNCLFETIESMTKKYGIDIDQLLNDISDTISSNQ